MSKYEEFIEYAFSTSDCFSLVIDTGTTNSVDLEDVREMRYKEIAGQLSNYVISRRRLRPYEMVLTTGSCYNQYHEITFYTCCEETKQILLKESACVYDWEGDCRPADLHFYRNNQKTTISAYQKPAWLSSKFKVYVGKEPWYYCCGHDRYDRLHDITDADYTFFADNYIAIEQEMDQPQCWKIYWDKSVRGTYDWTFDEN